jgi:hypothetical protein
MALQSSCGLRTSSLDLLRVVLVVATVVALMLVLTWALGVARGGPSYEIVPDPAGILPF